MAPAGTRRARKAVASDSEESDASRDSPRPQKLRKRLSEAHAEPGATHQSQQDSSFTVENGQQRVPLKSVNMNEDDAEKRRRRKSAKHALEAAGAGPSSEGNDPDASRSMAGRRQQPLNAVSAEREPAAVPKLSKDVMNSNFEEWMKMATDNKINATNSWDFALIDYFHDMSLLRNNDDNSINFQRASCTLDGCVKIWTSRVDSVGTETGKLLSNLASGGKEIDEEEDSDNPDADPSQPKKKKTVTRPTNNLVKDYSSLTNKKLDLEFSVDPLFKKTCADFDEGGAGGLLLNHLSLGIGNDGGMRVIFDASDSFFDDGAVIEEEPEDLIDISELRAAFLPDHAVLDDKTISRSLASFSFNKPFDPDTDEMPIGTQFTEPFEDDASSDGDQPGGDFGGEMEVDPDDNQNDFFAGAEAINEDPYEPQDQYGDGDGENGSAGPEGDGVPGTGRFEPFDPRNAPNEREFAMAGDDDAIALDYFDSKVMKNWAGPEHWKLRRTIKRAGENDENKPAKKPAAKKEPERIDFLAPCEKSLKEIADELFAPPGKGQTINLPGTGPTKRGKRKREQAKKDEHLLPDDMHFSSRQLVTLFLKPKFMLRMRGKRARVNADSGEVDDNHWAQVAANREDDDGQHSDQGEAQFDTGFDDFGDDAFDEGVTAGIGSLGLGGNDDAGEQDLLAATQGIERKVKPEFVNYAKRAKRVDVRKLKENIWKGLDIVVVEDSEDEDMDVDGDNARKKGRRSKSNKPPTDPSEARQFSQVITGLQRTYPKEKLDEISTSFCFICLLHLANEQGLKLEVPAVDGLTASRRRESVLNGRVEDEEDEVMDTIIPDDEDDLIAAGGVKVEDEKPIGEIWDIKIYRDPTATRSA